MSDELADALEGLITGVTFYKIATKAPTYPYVLGITSFPTVQDRSLTRSGQSHRVRMQTTSVGLSAESLRWVLERVVPVLEHAKLTVPGWSLGRVELVNERPPDVDYDYTDTATGLNPVVQVHEWHLTASKL